MVKQEKVGVYGMQCDACVAAAQRALERLVGVDAVKVDLADESADIHYQADVLTLAQIAKAIEGAGFSVDPSQ